ncbi:MAG: hypothetical protein DVB23_001509 [Verrucomicrobia bacterium]|jgi:hypothetical protein|nr:MAG: hypothetical protein DVB23_001509 [Verrucomicrobiota bacterium]
MAETHPLRLDPVAWIAIASACIAVLAALLAVQAAVRLTRIPPLPLQVPPAPAWVGPYFDSVLRWADHACRELALAIHLAELPPDPGRDRQLKFSEIRASLAHLIDTGRWYFPNASAPNPQMDRDHPPAYRGQRHPALDLLVAARELIGKTDPIGVAALVRAKSEFVSHIQILVNPRQREEGIASVLQRFAAVGEEPGQLG